MANISITVPSDGQTADAADVATPLNMIVTDYNGNIDNSNIAAAAAIAGSKLADGGITNAKLSTSSGEIGGAWGSWVPTWTNVTIGNATVTAKYQQVGKTVHYRLSMIFGSSTSISGTVTFSLPVTSVTHAGGVMPIGQASIIDSGTAAYSGAVIWASTTTAAVRVDNSAGTYSVRTVMSSTVPMTWVTTDELSATGEYEAA